MVRSAVCLHIFSSSVRRMEPRFRSSLKCPGNVMSVCLRQHDRDVAPEHCKSAISAANLNTLKGAYLNAKGYV